MSVSSTSNVSSGGSASESSARGQKKLGMMGLVALVVGSMIGGGVFDLPKNMASGAAAGAVLIGWIITAVGMIPLALAFQNLSMRKPELDAGIYSYARAGFGEFIGFNSAWGYWISAWLGNIAYATLVFSALSYFIPAFGQGNNLLSILCASVILWLIQGLTLSGARQTALVNIVVTIAKLVPLLVFIVAVIFAFHASTFVQGFWGSATAGVSFGSVMGQTKSTMLVTLWVFIGVEGAVVLSGRAANRRDIGRATVLGLLGTMVIYVLVTVMAFGVMNQAQLAGLHTPSVAYVLRDIVGPWGAALINIGLIVSVLGAWLGWTLLAAEIPYVAAKEGIFPKQLANENSHGSARASLWLTNGLIQLFLILILFASSTYETLYSMATTAILVPYLFSALYQLKTSITGDGYLSEERRGGDIAIGIIATVYALWLIYAAGLSYLLQVAILYAPGIIVFWWARRQARQQVFKPYEIVIAVFVVLVAVIALWLLAAGKISV